jgi:predicted TIM-barrel fold metal-dependent hydrolase
MKIGRFVVDGHIHGSTLYRPAGKPKEGEAVRNKIHTEIEPYDNSEMIIYDMDAYGVNMGILKPSFAGTVNEMQAQMVDNNPTRFRALCSDQTLRLKCARGEAEWTIEAACEEIEAALNWGKGRFVGIGEFAPGGMGVVRKPPTFAQRLDEFRELAKLASKYDISIEFHEYDGFVWGGGLGAGYGIVQAIAREFPEVRIIIEHGGGQYPEEIRAACTIAGMADNVYLETGYWRAEYYELALKDPNLGATRLIWGGGDNGSSLWSHFPTQPGAKYRNPTGNWLQKKWPIPLPYQPDWLGWPTHQIHRLKDLDLATQDEINLIVGGNAAKVYKLPVPMERMFACGRPDLSGIHWEKTIPYVPDEQVQKREKP